MKRFILPLLWGILSGLLFMGSAGLAKEKPSLSASRMTLKAGDSAFIVLQGNPNNLVSWSVTSGKKMHCPGQPCKLRGTDHHSQKARRRQTCGPGWFFPVPLHHPD